MDKDLKDLLVKFYKSSIIIALILFVLMLGLLALFFHLVGAF